MTLAKGVAVEPAAQLEAWKNGTGKSRAVLDRRLAELAKWDARLLEDGADAIYQNRSTDLPGSHFPVADPSSLILGGQT